MDHLPDDYIVFEQAKPPSRSCPAERSAASPFALLAPLREMIFTIYLAKPQSPPRKPLIKPFALLSC
jgi:hypothetical protein